LIGPAEPYGQPRVNFPFTISVQFINHLRNVTMASAIRALIIAASVCFSTTGSAAELSPWLGNEGQTPFQLDPNTMVAVTFAADPLHTGSLSTAPCPPSGCATSPNTARTGTVATGTPKN
jgi:hypothetical protein